MAVSVVRIFLIRQKRQIRQIRQIQLYGNQENPFFLNESSILDSASVTSILE